MEVYEFLQVFPRSLTLAFSVAADPRDFLGLPTANTLVSTGWAEDREVLHLLCSLLAYTAGSFHIAGEHWTSDPLRNKTVSRPRVLANGMQGSISKSKSLCSDPRELSLLLPEHFTTSCMLEMITERHNLAQC